jgi:amino acid adenylation domain-containing protein
MRARNHEAGVVSYTSVAADGRGTLREWNATCTHYPRDKTVSQLFEEVAERYGDSIALVFEHERLTYRELNARANRIANRLRGVGVGSETMVGCCITRSPDLIVGMIAILKAGGAYVPLDPNYPKERFDFLLSDSRPLLILADSSLASTVLANCGVPILLADDCEANANATSEGNLEPLGHSNSLAYVMYTSGSTGLPKGVMVENRAIVRLVRDTNYCKFGPEEVFLQYAPISFDASTFEIWGALLNGGRLVVMPPQASSLGDLGRVIREQGVTTVWLTAGLFHLIVEEGLEDLGSVRQLLAGGDVLSPFHVRRVLAELPNCCLINGYGPTENTTFTCCHVMRGTGAISHSVPIGRPISNTRAYILDDQLQPVRPGVIGELYAGGDGIARGYLNNPDATNEKFLTDHFSEAAGARMYRTGDLACWRADGIIEFHGRADDQIKILGHRVEPAEVEVALGACKSIKQVCVVPYTDENRTRRLVAYYVGSLAGVTANELRAFLAQKVPQYMIPAAFVPLDALPLSPNGKVDRAVLPRPWGPPIQMGVDAEPEANQLEKTIADLWSQVLGAKEVGLDSNFFDLGGDSLSLVAIHSNLQKKLKLEIQITDLFEFTTVRMLARHLSRIGTHRHEFSEVQERAQKQREAFARQRDRRMA